MPCLVFRHALQRGHLTFALTFRDFFPASAVSSRCKASVFFDFSPRTTVHRLSFSSTPGDSLRTYFSSQAAALKGSQNHAGIADPTVDKLIDIIIAANTREELITACRALDRVIRSGRYWIPHWYKASHWLAYWDVFSRPPQKPKYARGVLETWWYDREKAAKLEQRG